MTSSPTVRISSSSRPRSTRTRFAGASGTAGRARWTAGAAGDGPAGMYGSTVNPSPPSERQVPTTTAWWPVPVGRGDPDVVAAARPPRRVRPRAAQGCAAGSTSCSGSSCSGSKLSPAGRGRGWPSYSSLTTRSSAAEPELGQRLFELELGDLHPDVRVLGPHAGDGRDEQAAGRGLQAAGADRAAHLAGQRGQVGAGGVGRGQQDAGVLGQQAAGVGQPHAAAGLLQQPHADLLLQDGQLLGDRGRGVAERGGDRGEGPPLLQLAEHAQPAQVQHHVGTLTRWSRFITGRDGIGRRGWRAWVPHCACSRRRASARWPSSASSRTRPESRRVRCCCCGSAWRRCCSGCCWLLRPGLR